MKVSESLRVYYSFKHQYDSKWSKLNFILADGDKVIYRNKRSFIDNSRSSSRYTAFNKVIRTLEQLEARGLIHSDRSVTINLSQEELFTELSSLGGNKSSKGNKRIRIKQLTDRLMLHNNWILSYNSNSLKEMHRLYEGINILSGVKRRRKKTPVIRRISENLKVQEQSIVFFDIEMNCSTDKNNRTGSFEAISIGAVKFSPAKGTMEKFYSLIKPNINSVLSNKCYEITGITQEEVDSAEDFKTVMLKFQKWLKGDSCIFVSWGAEDIKTLKRDNNRNGYKLQIINYIRKNYIDFQREFSFYYLNTKQGVSLVNAIKAVALDFKGMQHNALDDAYNLYKVYEGYINKIEHTSKEKNMEAM